MSMQPVSAEEVAEAVCAHPHVAAVGGGSKKDLVGAGERIELSKLSGITEYEASEYTITAKAGTPVREVKAALQAKGQYLPFDPLFVESGATLGGTVASGLSGPGRFRFGGLRDFIIGVQFVDGKGRLVRSGGKVVKNAAGFDLPKFLVGSLGRLGILTEVTFKVFPAPEDPCTFRIACPDHCAARDRLAFLAGVPWEADALDYDAAARVLHVRYCTGMQLALSLEMNGRWPGEVEQLRAEEAERIWEATREMKWVGPDEALAKIAMTPRRLPEFQERVEQIGGGKAWYSSGGALAWYAFGSDRLEVVESALEELEFSGLAVRGREGESSSPLLGRKNGARIVSDVKTALDPEGRFPAF